MERRTDERIILKAGVFIGLMFLVAGLLWALVGQSYLSGDASLLALCLYSTATWVIPSLLFFGRKIYTSLLHPLRLAKEDYLFILIGSVGVWLLAYVSIYGSELLLSRLGFSTHDPTATLFESKMYHGLSGWLLNIFCMALLPAVSEELYFRLGLQSLLVRLHPDRPWIGILFTAIIFSAMHYSGIGFIGRMLWGCWFGYLYQRTGSIYVPIGIHFLNNFVSLLFSIG